MPQDRALLGLTDEHVLLVSQAVAYSVVGALDFLPVTDSEAWLLERSRDRPILVAYMHSISEICGYVVFADGQRLASHFHIDGDDTLEPPTAAPPAWLQDAPTTYTEDYVFELAAGFMGRSLHEAFAAVPTWALFQVDGAK